MADLGTAAEAGSANSGTGTTQATAATTAGTETAAAGDTKTISMVEAERIATERATRAEQSAMKSYLQQQGMTEEEIKEAITAHKASKAAKAEADKGNLTAVQKRAEEAESKLTTAEKSANARIISAEAKGVARDLGVSKESIPYVLKLADLSKVKVDANGDPDSKELEAAINKVLTDVPALKGTESASGFKAGADGKGKTDTTEEQLANAFGIKKKKE